MLRNRSISAAAAAMILAALVPATVAPAAVVYRAAFGNGTTGNLTVTNVSIGWNGHHGATATATSGTGVPSMTVSNLDGRPINLANVNAGTTASQVFGFAVYNGNGTRPGLVWTGEHSIDRSAWDVTSVSWYEGNTHANIRARAAIRIGSGWYVSNTQFGGTSMSNAANFDTAAVLRTLNFSTAAAAWSTLNFTPGSQLSVGPTLASALPGGNITGFGLYFTIPNGTQRARFDTFQIDANLIPEPGAAALALVGAGALLMRRRRGA